MELNIPTFLLQFKKPWHIMAPMQFHADEAFRILVKRYDTHFGYTEMVNILDKDFKNINKVENKWFSRKIDKSPLVIQICGNNPQGVLEAALLLQDSCDAIDFNLESTSSDAYKDGFGAYLMNDLSKLEEIVKTVSSKIKVPFFCKTRVFESIEDTIKYAKMLEKAGCALLTVHGRTIKQTGKNSGFVSLDHIKAVKEALSIPVISNGGILKHEDIQKTINYTNYDGVMIAEPLLVIPTIFSNSRKTTVDIGLEYLNIVKENPETSSFLGVQLHFKKIFHKALEIKDLNEIFNKVKNLDDYVNFIEKVKANSISKPSLLNFQPYIRNNGNKK